MNRLAGWLPRVWLVVCLSAFPVTGMPLEFELDGVPGEIEERVRNAINIPSRVDAAELDESEARRLANRGARQLQNALRAFGYYRAEIDLELSAEASDWKVVYRVNPGEQVVYDSVLVDVQGPGRTETSVSLYLESQPLQVGGPVHHDVYETVKQGLIGRLLTAGYLDAHLVESRVEIDPDAYRAEARLIAESGPLFRFGDVRMIQDVLDPEFVSTFVQIEKGERFSDRPLIELEQGLRDSGYFSDVRIRPRPDLTGEDGLVPIDVELTPGESADFEIGAGFGTDTGVRGSFSWDQLRVNKHGHRFGIDLRASQIGASLDAHYTIPFDNPRTDYYQLIAGYLEDDIDTHDSDIASLGVLRSTQLGPYRMDLSFVYEAEDFRVADQVGSTELFIPGARLSRIEADNRLLTSNGYRWDASVQGTSGLISDVPFLQPRLTGKWIKSLNGFRFLARGDAAMTMGQLEDLPASLRFYAGGDQSVRGFEFDSLGPVNADGEVTGGRHLLVGSVELDYAVSDAWRVATFFDAGNAFDTFDERLEQSVGIGVRFITPIGPVRVDLAQPVSDDSKPVRLHISMGPDL